MATALEKLSRAFKGREFEKVIDVPVGEGRTTPAPSPSDPSLMALRKAALKSGFKGVCLDVPGLKPPRGGDEKALMVVVEEDQKQGVFRVRDIRPRSLG